MPLRWPARLPFWGSTASSFELIEPGPLIDGDLELVPPADQWIDAVLEVCHHPFTLQESPALAQTTRSHLKSFIRTCPGGFQNPTASRDQAPTYQFWMHVAHGQPAIAGGIGLRIGQSYELVMYYGHIGYHVYPPARGHHYAERACRLLLPLAIRHGLDPLWITCDPRNPASRRTCERLGGKLVEIVPVPIDHPLYQRGETEKCRYRIDLA